MRSITLTARCGRATRTAGRSWRTDASSDDQLRELIERDALIGAAFDAWMLVPGWVRRESTPEGMGVSLESVANHIDHICQLAGNASHCMIGLDSTVDSGESSARATCTRSPTSRSCPAC